MLPWKTNGDGWQETAMRKTVVPLLESPDDIVRGVVPKWLYQIPAPTPAEVDAVRAMCVRRGCADVLTVLGVAS